MRKFPSIEQFRHVVADVTHKATYLGQNDSGEALYDTSRPKPVLTFRGTVKLHGSNCGIEFDLLAGTTSAQSRERVLSVEDDNFGFCAWMQSEEGAIEVASLRALLYLVAERRCVGEVASLHLFGEWCGPAVNGKTAIGRLPMRWVLFRALATQADGTEVWLDVNELAAARRANVFGVSQSVFFIGDYRTWELAIDFNDPAASLEALEQLTLEVEASCPVAMAMGGEGIGEGIVWECHDTRWGHHCFKTKGAKHKGTKGKVVTVAPEVLASQAAFVDAVLTESRLEQGFELIRTRYGKVTEDRIGDFLRWVGMDVLKEESDTLTASGLERRQVMGAVNRAAKAWLMPRLARF